jgi:hypothetical protein
MTNFWPCRFSFGQGQRKCLVRAYLIESFAGKELVPLISAVLEKETRLSANLTALTFSGASSDQRQYPRLRFQLEEPPVLFQE